MDFGILENPNNVYFNDLIHVCTAYLSEPRKGKGGHLIFKTPFRDDPFINIQPDKKNKKMAKPYQVRQAKRILTRMEEEGYGPKQKY